MFPMMEAKEITFTQTGEASAALQGEYALVRQAVENLLQNAIEFTPRRGKITVHVGKTPTHVELVVKDSGAGIPTYAVERVFERFYSLSRPDTGKKSSGLGLSVVKQVVLLHQGEVTVRNAPEGGVEARLVFPQSFTSLGEKKTEV
ncbi:MAG: ATP-binding protein [Candidatus Binatia bacterium]